MRRALALVIVAGLAAGGAMASAQAPAGFPDVPDDHPRKADIDYAVARGWFQGYGDGTFQPDRKITPSQITSVVRRVFDQISEEGVSRLDMALFMRYGNRVLDNPAPPILPAPDFSDWPPDEEDDVNINEEVAQSAAYGVIRGWFKGYPDGTFRAEDIITAGQIAKVVIRAFPRGISRAEMADFIRHGNGAVVSHEASVAWDRVEAAYVTTQIAWREACDAWTNYRPVAELTEAAWNAERDAFTATAVAWRADVGFWETVDDRRRIENEALSSAQAAAEAWDAAAAAKDPWDETGYVGFESLGEVLGDALAVDTPDRKAERVAWNTSQTAVRATDLAEQDRASLLLTEAEQAAARAWDGAVEAVNDAVAVWDDFAVVGERTPRETCQDWDEAWNVWEDWAAAMAVANDALVIGA